MSPIPGSVHDRWDTPSFELDPVAPRTGPFVHQDLLETWWRHRGGKGEVCILDSGEGLVPLWMWDGNLRFIGEEELIDYHSPLGTGTDELIAGFVRELEPGTELRFDSLPQEAAGIVSRGLAAAGVPTEPVRHEVAAVLDLPASYEDWLSSLGRKERHEVRRKLRRFEEAGGLPKPERNGTPEAVRVFCELHRKAGGEKGEFMTAEMEAYFTSLHEHAGGVVDILSGPQGAPVAAAFGFEDDAAYYLYNSAYEPAASSLSPGIVLLSALVRRAIHTGRQTFDFLKGDEDYKFRHGARPRPLYEIRAVVGGPP